MWEFLSEWESWEWFFVIQSVRDWRGVVFGQMVVKIDQGMTDDSIVAVVVDELDPSCWIVGLVGDVTEWESQTVAGGWVEFDFAGNVMESSRFE